MVAVVITAYNHAHFLDEAIKSCLSQTLPVDEIIVVDDGSTDDPGVVISRYSNARLIRQENQGLAAARNTGLFAATSEYITFLDADDRLLPLAMQVGVAKLSTDPTAILAYGAYRYIDGENRVISGKIHVPVIGDPYRQLLRRGNFIGMHSTVVYRRQSLAKIKGFDAELRSCEDYELFFRAARAGRIIAHEEVVAEYRMHGENMSLNRPMMLASALRVLDRQLVGDIPEDVRRDADEGRTFWTEYYAGELTKSGLQYLHRRPIAAARMLVRSFRMAPLAFFRTTSKKVGRRLLRHAPAFVGRSISATYWTPRKGHVKFGDFARTSPISESFGFDRGLPVDRYYIENFLARNSADIRGRVLEIGDNSYTRAYGGGRVGKSDVLHVDPNDPNATIIGDLSVPGTLPDDAFDCVVLTQTLHLIFDMPKAVAHLAAALKPGGVLLVTVPGITPVDRGEWGDTWFWSLTEAALSRLLAGPFEPRNISMETYGNVFAAVSFLQGLAREEVSSDKLDVRDAAFPVIVTARVVKE